MKLQGFINGAYQLDSVNVDSQRCVNLYPEEITSGSGKGNQRAYLRPTPGLDLFQTVGDGPIRCVHRDSIGRILVVSADELYRVTPRAEWTFEIWTGLTPISFNLAQATDINLGTDEFTETSHGLITGQEVTVSSTVTLPTGLSASTTYYVIRVDDNTFQLATTEANAAAGTQIDITGLGTGTLTTLENTPLPGSDSDTYSEINYVADVDYSTDQITLTNHQLHNGAKVYFGAFGTPLPGNIGYGLNPSNPYYVKKVDSNTIKLATSPANITAGTYVDLTSDASTYYVGRIAERSAYDPADEAGGSSINFTTSSGTVIARSGNTSTTQSTATTIFADGANYVALSWNTVGGMQATRPFTITTEPTHVAWIDGYYILNQINTNQFYVTALNDITVAPLDFAASEGSPDLIMGHIENNRNLWIFNEKSTELFINTGNPDFPFERVQNGFMEVGCAAKYSIAKIDGTVLWLGRSEHGEGVVYMANSFNPQRISNHPIEQKFAGYADINSATAYTYEFKGHKFYVINFTEATWCYDLSTGIWHERAYTTAGVLGRQLGESHEFNQGENAHLVGDYSNGKLYKYNETTYTDNGDSITRLRTTPHFSNELERIICDELQLDMETGVGLVSGQGSDPQVMLDWSDDGGHTWSDESWTSAGGQSGGIGEYSTRVRWRRLGQFRDRIFRFKITDPVKTYLIDAFMKIRPGRN